LASAGDTAKIHDLSALLKDYSKPAAVRLEAAKKLADLGAAMNLCVGNLQIALRDRDEEIRYHALLTLNELGLAGRFVSLKFTLADPSVRIRLTAITVLHNLGPLAGTNAPALVDCLKDKEIVIRRRAAIALGVIHAYPEQVVPALLAAMDDPDPGTGGESSVCECAVRSIAYFGPRGHAALPELLKRFETSDDLELKDALLYTIPRLQAEPARTIPFLRNLLNNPDTERFRSSAARGLAEFGVQAQDCVPDLLEALKCANLREPKRKDGTQEAVLYALGSMGQAGSKQLPTIIAVCQDRFTSGSVKQAAIDAIARLGKNAEDAVPFLISCLNDPQYSPFSSHIAIALRNIGRPALEPLLENFSAQSGQPHLGHTIRALAALGPLARPALPLLEIERDTGSHSGTARIAIDAISRGLDVRNYD